MKVRVTLYVGSTTFEEVVHVHGPYFLVSEILPRNHFDGIWQDVFAKKMLSGFSHGTVDAFFKEFEFGQSYNDLY